VVYSYKDHVDNVDLYKKILDIKCEVLVLDRYDMYNGDQRIVEAAYYVAKTGITLIDVKSSVVPGITDYDYADIYMYPDRIEVRA